ncbi:HDIG domain-containing metalloprotein [Acetoanaerobium noterae]|uniref:HDIG domain-containing metalloprotein n=1 Tax=Acetoanaerobium noterae TaxID=745369 RepID=UPI003320C7A8
MSIIPTRTQAWELLNEYNQTEYLIKHALEVEGVMRYFANLLGEEDVDRWALIGLLHDLDYEKYPDEHCIKVQEILRERDIDESIIKSIVSHGYGLVADIKPEHQMEKVLFCIDELCGLIHAAAIMRPSKSVMDMEVKSVRKKFKSPSFAAGVSREVIQQGLDMLGWELDYAIEHTILGMREVAEEIGLK